MHEKEPDGEGIDSVPKGERRRAFDIRRDAPHLIALGALLEISESDSETVREHIADLERLPDGVVQALVRAQVRVRIGDRLVRDFPEAAGLNLQRASNIAIYSRRYRIAMIGRGATASQSPALHEVGHALGDIEGWNGDTGARAAWEATLGEIEDEHYENLTDPEKAIRETIAETFADLIMNGNLARERWGDLLIDRMVALIASLA